MKNMCEFSHQETCASMPSKEASDDLLKQVWIKTVTKWSPKNLDPFLTLATV